MKTGKLQGPVDNIQNLYLKVNAAVNKLDIFARSNTAAPDASNIILVNIPDGNGNVYRKRAGTYLSGTGQFVMADAANYWSKGSLDAEIKTAYVYAIWDGTGIVWALGGYSGFTRVPASTTATDDDFFLLEASSTYTKVITDYCVCVGKIRYQYDTADAPDHTIQATVLDAPQVIWNPKSDYGYQKNLATTNTVAGDIAAYSAVSVLVKQSGKYFVTTQAMGLCTNDVGSLTLFIKTGSSTYGSAVQKAYQNSAQTTSNRPANASCNATVYLNAGDTIHLGVGLVGGVGNEIIYGDNDSAGCTALNFSRID